MKYFLIGIIKMYQMIPIHAHSLCKYNPSCSQYTIEAIKEYGSIKGTYLGIKRIIRCNPFNKGGYDPIPSKERN